MNWTSGTDKNHKRNILCVTCKQCVPEVNVAKMKRIVMTWAGIKNPVPSFTLPMLSTLTIVVTLLKT